MTTIETSLPVTFNPGRAALRLVGSALVAFGVFLSGFVIAEPAPFDVYMAVLIGFWFILGLKISRTTAVLLAFMLVFMAGGFLSITQMEKIGDAPIYLAVTLFLCLSAVFLCAIIDEDHRRLKLIFNAWTAAAVTTAMLGILGYFKAFPGAEIFTRYDRAMGAFQDPNVFGPFLIAPSLFLLHGILTEKISGLPVRAIALGIISLGVLLSFSRAAWAMFAFSAAMMVLLMFIKERSGAFRLKVLIITLGGIVFCVVAIVVALQIPQVADLLTSRTKLVQDYGWLGFITYIGLVWTTIWFGLRYMLRDRPWQPYLLIGWIAICGHELIGNVIDTDHWRHHFMLFGIVWGCIALEHKYQRRRARNAMEPA